MIPPRCKDCPAAIGDPCTPSQGKCRRVGEPGQDAFRSTIARQARIRARQATRPSVIPCGESLGLIVRMKSCPNWVARSDCGCGVNECRAGKGKAGLVNHADCRACLQEEI